MDLEYLGRELLHYILLAVAIIFLKGFVLSLVAQYINITYVSEILAVAILLLIADKILHKSLRLR